MAFIPMERSGGELLRKAARKARSAANRGRPPQAPVVPRPERWDPTNTSAFYLWCVANGVDTRPQYLWPLLHSAHAAANLGIEKISALEFGVAGGNGLLALERAAAAAGELSGTQIEIFGFDTGEGMPPAEDPRDAPWLIEPSMLRMDQDALRARLTSAQLVLGDVAETVGTWAAEDHPPVGFIAFDLDYYSSTVAAFGLLEAAADRMLPRVPCYFDDLFGHGWTDFMGVRAAIDEFNAGHDLRKIAKIHGLRFELPPAEFRKAWHEKIYLIHLFDHPRYADLEGKLDQRFLEEHRLSSA
jgi:hypothetical protein